MKERNESLILRKATCLFLFLCRSFVSFDSNKSDFHSVDYIVCFFSSLFYCILMWCIHNNVSCHKSFAKYAIFAPLAAACTNEVFLRWLVSSVKYSNVYEWHTHTFEQSIGICVVFIS